MDEKREYWAFISYRHLDNKDAGREWASWIAREIETYEVPPELVGTKGSRGDVVPERIYPVFRDEDELSADADLSSPIYEALRNSKTVIVVCSPRAVASRYVGNEITYFKSLGREDRVLAMMIEGEPHAPGERECFPEALKHHVDDGGNIDPDSAVEPVAADFRLPDGSQGWHSKKKYRSHFNEELAAEKYRERCDLAKLKLIAGILGVPLGKLIERDKAYQLAVAKRKARIFTAVAVAMSVLAVLAIIAGSIATKERDRAQKSEQVALHARGTAENLITEILFDLGNKLKPIGKLDLLDDVSLAAENYFISLPPDQIDAETERNRSAMLDSRARVLEASGDLGGALGKYQEALALDRHWASERPDEWSRQIYVALSLSKVADILRQQNKQEEAHEKYSEALELVRGIADHTFGGSRLEIFAEAIADPASANAAHMILSADEGKVELVGLYALLLERIAGHHASRGRTEKAKDLLLESIRVNDTLSRFAPSNDASRRNLVTGLYQAGAMLESEGNPEEAIPWFRRVVEIARKSLASDPGNAEWRDILAGGLEKLTATSLFADPAEAQKHAESALPIRRELADGDPSNLERKRNLYVALRQGGFAAKAVGDDEKARRYLSEALALIEELVSADPSNVMWKKDYALCLQGRAKSFFTAGDFEAAGKSIQRAIAQFQKVLEDDPSDTRTRRSLYFSFSEAADIATALGKNGAALQFSRKSVEAATTVLENTDEPTAQNFVDNALARNRIGTLERIAGQHDQALASLAKAIEFGEKAIESSPDDVGLRRNLIDPYMETGAAYWAMNDFTRSAEFYGRAAETANAVLSATETASLGDLLRAAYSLNQEFFAQRAMLDNESALATAQEEIELRNRITEQSDDPALKSGLQKALANAGTASWFLGEFESAFQYYLEAAKVGGSVVAELPAPTLDSRSDLIGIYGTLGNAYESQSQTAEAISWHEKSIAAAEEANELGITNENWSSEAIAKAKEKVERLKERVPRTESHPE